MAHQFFFNPYILDNLPAPRTGFDVVQDVSEPRLRMYITSRGVKTFFVRKRVGGRDRRIIIGNYPDMDIEDARSALPDVLARASQKVRTRRRKISFEKFVDIYMTGHVRREEFACQKLMRAIRRHLHPLFEKDLCAITSNDVADVIGAIRGDAIAVRMQELLQSVFKYAIENGYAKHNPVQDVPRRVQNRRVRPLTRGGFNRLLNVINNWADQTQRAAFLMLIYGFAPKAEIFAMQWEDLDFNHDMWGDRPLSDAAVVLLQDLPQDGLWVFPGRGLGHLTDPRVAWRRVAAAAKIPNLTMDDVHKFLMRQVAWAPDKEDFRSNMNMLLDEITVPVV